MRLPAIIAVFALIQGIVLGIAAGAVSADEPVVSGLRLGENGERTRFVIDIDRDAEPKIFTLPDPYRLVIDLPAVKFALDGQGVGEGRGLVERYRYGLFSKDTARIVLDLERAVELDRFFTLAPQGPHSHRLVFDLKPTSRKQFLADAKTPHRVERTPPDRRAAAEPPETPQRDQHRVVVLDAGHGGNDPGATGVRGVPEKSITLSVAKQAYRLLKSTGRYEPVLTRQRDVYVSLQERVDMARAQNADLFVSLHADSLNNRNVRGATVYTLSETASDERAAELARRENRADIVAGVDLGQEAPEVAGILIDLAQRETMNYSARFANLLLPQLRERVVLRRNSHRFAGFVVLKAPDVPSVLVEMGYMSNPQDAAMLGSRDGQRRIARALLAAIDRYFSQREQARY